MQASEQGLPLQRLLFLHHEDDARTYAEQTQYLFGRDLLVAPVLKAAVRARLVYLPTGADCVHVWSGEGFKGGQSSAIATAFGQLPVFYRAGAQQFDLFQSLRSL